MSGVTYKSRLNPKITSKGGTNEQKEQKGGKFSDVLSGISGTAGVAGAVTGATGIGAVAAVPLGIFSALTGGLSAIVHAFGGGLLKNSDENKLKRIHEKYKKGKQKKMSLKDESFLNRLTKKYYKKKFKDLINESKGGSLPSMVDNIKKEKKEKKEMEKEKEIEEITNPMDLIHINHHLDQNDFNYLKHIAKNVLGEKTHMSHLLENDLGDELYNHPSHVNLEATRDLSMMTSFDQLNEHLLDEHLESVASGDLIGGGLFDSVKFIMNRGFHKKFLNSAIPFIYKSARKIKSIVNNGISITKKAIPVISTIFGSGVSDKIVKNMQKIKIIEEKIQDLMDDGKENLSNVVDKVNKVSDKIPKMVNKITEKLPSTLVGHI